MSYISGFIVIFLYCCLNTVKAKTGDSDPGLVPEASLVYIDYSWNHTLNLPESDPWNLGILVKLTATWKTAPKSNAEYAIKFIFEHPNFNETKIDVMKIPHDKSKDINICFSPCPIGPSEIYKNVSITLYAETENIPVETPVDVEVTVENDYSRVCRCDRPYVTVLGNVISIDVYAPTFIAFALVIVGLVCALVYYKIQLGRRYMRRRGPGGGLEGGPPPPGGGGPGQRPHGGDPSTGGDYMSVGTDEDPSEDPPPGSGSQDGGPTDFRRESRLRQILRQIFGGGKTVIEQPNVAESVALPNIKGSGGPRGHRKPGTKKNKLHDE